MSFRLTSILSAAVLAALAMAPAACTSAAPATGEAHAPADAAAKSELLTYVAGRRSTGFVVIQNGSVLIDETWPAPDGDPAFANFVYGHTSDGALLEDVASQQKSFIAVLVAIAIDRGLLDINKPVSAYLGAGWSKASAEQEARIRVVDVLTMSSGLDEKFAYSAPAGTTFFYNTPVYASIKDVLSAAAKTPLADLTREWLTAPAGMTETAWRQRPAALASVGNSTGLVTTPGDVAKFGLLILHDGVAGDGTRVVSEQQVRAMFERSSANPSYGKLWWLNGGAYSVRATGDRKEGQLTKAAPADLVAALGAFDRRLYVVPSLDLVVVRTGAAVQDPEFDETLWRLLGKVLDATASSGGGHADKE